jgi:hypothetical protein
LGKIIAFLINISCTAAAEKKNKPDQRFYFLNPERFTDKTLRTLRKFYNCGQGFVH